MTAEKRRWYRFNLRTLFVAFTLAAWWIASTTRFVRDRREFLSTWAAVVHAGESASARFREPPAQIPWLRSLMGDVAIQIVWLSHGTTETKLNRVERLFPEASVIRCEFDW